MSQQRKTYTIIFFPIILILLRIGECGGGKTSSASKSLGGAGGSSMGDSEQGQHFAMEPQDQTAIVGSRVTLPCRVIDKVGALQWTKDDFGLGEHRNLSGFERYSMVGSDEEGDFSLDIYPLMLDDDAKYQCQVGPGPKGQPGIRSRFATLTVLVPPEPPKIVQGDYLVTTEDREIELECISAGGKPAADITWIDGLGTVIKNGSEGFEYFKEPLADSRRFTAKSILKITPKKEHHNTTFTCQAQNTADRSDRSAKLLLEVKYAPKVSVSVIGGALSGGRIPEGAEVRLSCHADANPNELSYRWYINDELIVGDYTTELMIHNVSRNYHDAIVKCEVHNPVGKSEESETLDISYGPIMRHHPKSIEADSGTRVTLSCDVDGNPPPDIVWMSEYSDRVVGTSPNLTITVSDETAGRYFCKASVMGFTEIGAEAAVYLKRSPTIAPNQRQYGIIGDTSRIECIAISVPMATLIAWTFNGHEINTTNDLDYAILEDQLPEGGIKSTLIIRESQSKHFGRYNCTVVNEYGNDVLEIDFIAHRSIPMLMIIVGAVSSVAITIMVIMLLVLYFKRGKKKLPPADVIPTDHHHINEKRLRDGGGGVGGIGCKESDRSSNISDLKVDIRAGSCEPDYSETCSGTDSIATRLAVNVLGGSTTGSNGGVGGVPLAGPVKIPNDYRYSGDYSDSLAHLQQHQQQLATSATTLMTSSAKVGGGPQQNNGYVPYVDYARDYSAPPPTLQSNQHHQQIFNSSTLRNNSSSNSSAANNTTTLSAAPTTMHHQHMNGQIPSSGNLSLTRNRNDHHLIRQDNGLPHNVQSSLNSLQNSLLGQPLLQNGLSIDPRYSATYGNPYLRTSNASLPPLPPPSTANPAATPAPPPYHAARAQSQLIAQAAAAAAGHHHHNTMMGSSNSSSFLGLGSNSQNSLLMVGSAATLPSQPSFQQQQQQMLLLHQTSNPQQQQQHHQVLNSPSGQFILPANGNLKKGALATHV